MHIKNIQRSFGAEDYEIYLSGVVSKTLGIKSILDPDTLALIESFYNPILIEFIKFYEARFPFGRIYRDFFNDSYCIAFSRGEPETVFDLVATPIDDGVVLNHRFKKQQFKLDHPEDVAFIGQLFPSLRETGMNPISGKFLHELKTLKELPEFKGLANHERVGAAIDLAKSHGILPRGLEVSISNAAGRNFSSRVTVEYVGADVASQYEDRELTPIFKQVRDVLHLIDCDTMEFESGHIKRIMVDLQPAIRRGLDFTRLHVEPYEIDGRKKFVRSNLNDVSSQVDAYSRLLELRHKSHDPERGDQVSDAIKGVLASIDESVQCQIENLFEYHEIDKKGLIQPNIRMLGEPYITSSNGLRMIVTTGLINRLTGNQTQDGVLVLELASTGSLTAESLKSISTVLDKSRFAIAQCIDQNTALVSNLPLQGLQMLSHQKRIEKALSSNTDQVSVCDESDLIKHISRYGAVPSGEELESLEPIDKYELVKFFYRMNDLICESLKPLGLKYWVGGLNKDEPYCLWIGYGHDEHEDVIQSVDISGDIENHHDAVIPLYPDWSNPDGAFSISDVCREVRNGVRNLIDGIKCPVNSPADQIKAAIIRGVDIECSSLVYVALSQKANDKGMTLEEFLSKKEVNDCDYSKFTAAPTFKPL